MFPCYSFSLPASEREGCGVRKGRMRILVKKKGEKDNNKVGGGIGRGERRNRPIHISHWWRHELPSTVMENEKARSEQGRSLHDILCYSV
jgi:hypothetical protein